MSFIDGVNGDKLTKDFIAQGRQCPIAAVVCLCRQLCEILEYVHEHGIIHRDFKPDNYLVQEDGTVFLVDFGIVRDLRDDPQTTLLTPTTIGTPAFLAPEQIRDAHAVDPRADLYSLGCSLFYTLLGRPPFSGMPFNDVLQAHLNAPRPRCDKERDDIPVWLGQLIFRLMAVDPAARPKSAGEVIWMIDCARIPIVNISEMRSADSVSPTVEIGARFRSRPDFISNKLLSASGRPNFVFHEDSRSEMALIPAGSMDVRVEKLEATIALTDFFMDFYPVTNAQFQAFVEDSHSRTTGDWQQHLCTTDDLQRPVRNVTWHDAWMYANWSGKSLPTEAQWLYAASMRGSQSHPWPNGISLQQRIDYGVPNNADERTAPPVVGGHIPNHFSIYDLCGTIKEWICDWFADVPFGLKPNTGKLHILNPCFLDQGTARVVRGSAWSEDFSLISLYKRSKLPPAQSSLLVGFRCVWNLQNPSSRD